MGIVDNIDKIIQIITRAKTEESTPDFNTAKDFKNRDVLVGLVRNKGQFDRLMKMKFYHIPMSQLSGCQMPIRYIAIYQSKQLFGNKSGVNYYGEVESYKTVPRCNIFEIPKNSTEPYLYVKIKKWHKLPNKIIAKEMDSVAFSTTMYLLKNSKDSAELCLRSETEYDFYRKLSKIVRKLVINQIPDHDDVVFGEYTVKLKGGLLYLYFGDVVQYVIGYDVFLNKPMDVIRDIFDYYPEI